MGNEQINLKIGNSIQLSKLLKCFYNFELNQKFD